MFHKEGSFSSPGGKKNQDTPLKKSDRRKLRDRFVSSFYGLDTDEKLKQNIEAVLDTIFLDFSNEILQRKIKILGNGNSTANFYLRTPSISSNDDTGKHHSDYWPYRTTQPILIELMDHPYPYTTPQAKTNSIVHWNQEKAAILIPTVAMLSVLPLDTFHRHCIPTISIPSSISKFLCRGAHLMRAGMSPRYCTMPLQSECLRHTRGFVVLTVHGNPQPFASGFLSPGTSMETLQSDEIERSKGRMNLQKGIGVLIITCYGDDLWRDCIKQHGHNDKFCRVAHNPTFRNFEDDSYGNPGFVDGRIVYAIQKNLNTDTSEKDEDSDDVYSYNCTDVETIHDVLEGEVESANDKNKIPLESLKLEHEDTISDASLEHLTEDDNVSQQHHSDIIQTTTALMTENHDDILIQAFYSSLLRLKKSDLPMLVSTFYSKHLLPCISPGSSFDLKNTSYKKVGSFLREQATKGIISLGASKDGKDPQSFLVNVNKGHAELKSPRLNANESNSENTAHDKKKLSVVNLYIIPSHFVALLQIDEDAVVARNAKSEQRKGTGFLTGPECRDILEHYLVINNLIDQDDHECVLMDGALCDVLFKKVMKQAIAKGENFVYPTRFSRKDLHQIWLESLDDAFAIVTMPGSNIITMKRGEAPKVVIEVIARQGNKKFVTRIRNVEDYGIDPYGFCNDVSKRFACAGSVDEECTGRESLKKGYVEVLFQGNLAEELKALITSDESSTIHGGAKDSIYCVPKTVIQIKLQKGVSKKTKK